MESFLGQPLSVARNTGVYSREWLQASVGGFLPVQHPLSWEEKIMEQSLSTPWWVWWRKKGRCTHPYLDFCQWSFFVIWENFRDNRWVARNTEDRRVLFVTKGNGCRHPFSDFCRCNIHFRGRYNYGTAIVMMLGRNFGRKEKGKHRHPYFDFCRWSSLAILKIFWDDHSRSVMLGGRRKLFLRKRE